MKIDEFPFYAHLLIIIGIGVALAVSLDNIAIGIGVATVFLARLIVRNNKIANDSGENND